MSEYAAKRLPPEVMAMAKKLFDEHSKTVPAAYPLTIVAEWLGERMPRLKETGAIWQQVRALEHRLKQHRCIIVEVPLLQWLEWENTQNQPKDDPPSQK